MSTTKKASDLSIVTSMATSQYLLLTEANGNLTRITYANLLASMLEDRSINQMNGNVFIMYGQDSNPRMVSPERWSSYSSYGMVGIVLVEGGRNLVISLDEPSAGTMYWNSAAGLCGAVTSTDRRVSAVDFEGESNTAAIVANANYEQSNPENYAPGFCGQYSRFSDTYGYGIAAGKWWLPSEGELLMMLANYEKINYALTVAGGTPLQRAYYWSSTESSSTNAWNLSFSHGSIGNYAKVSALYRVRPVSALQNLTLNPNS